MAIVTQAEILSGGQWRSAQGVIWKAWEAKWVEFRDDFGYGEVDYLKLDVSWKLYYPQGWEDYFDTIYEDGQELDCPTWEKMV